MLYFSYFRKRVSDFIGDCYLFEQDEETYLSLFINLIYLFLESSDNISPVNSLLSCMKEVQHWMASNFLQLNEDKTEAIFFFWHLPCVNWEFSMALGPLHHNLNPNVKNLGDFFDPARFNKQVSSMMKGCFFPIWATSPC